MNSVRGTMNYLLYNLFLPPGHLVEVSLSGQANVRLLDAANFARYKEGKSHNYYGGLALISPLRIKPPLPGHWHLVIDLGGYAGSVNASVRIRRG